MASRTDEPTHLVAMLLRGQYSAAFLGQDLLAGIIVAIMLVPQSLAYALLAGLPAEMGLYASIVPLVAYALVGSSRTLSVGPVAIISLMTAAAVGDVARQGTADYATAATALALLSGGILVLMGLFRLGALANFLSRSVVSGFITAAAIVIALAQFRHLLGVEMSGDTLPALLMTFVMSASTVNLPTVIVGVGTIGWLLWTRRQLPRFLEKLGVASAAAMMLAKAAPLLAVAVTTAFSYSLQLSDAAVSLVGEVPAGLPAFSSPVVNLDLWAQLLLPAFLISVIGFVESISVGKTLSAKSGDRVNPNRELLALGAANCSAAVSGGFPVTGGIARSTVNADAGAVTQMASVFAAIGIASVSLFFTPALYYLPLATLGATIVVAVTTLIDVDILKRAWRYSRSDVAAIATTIVLTLLFGVEIGVLSGILTSVGLHLFKTSTPHVAIVGAIPGTEHYRNVDRHRVETHPNLLSLRVDESLYFVNASFLESLIEKAVAQRPNVEHVILQCTAVNEIDLSALEVLEKLTHRLSARGVTLHLSEVKGPVMDALLRCGFPQELSGEIFLSHHQAVEQLKPEDLDFYAI